MRTSSYRYPACLCTRLVQQRTSGGILFSEERAPEWWNAPSKGICEPTDLILLSPLLNQSEPNLELILFNHKLKGRASSVARLSLFRPGTGNIYHRKYLIFIDRTERKEKCRPCYTNKNTRGTVSLIIGQADPRSRPDPDEATLKH